MLFQKCLTYHRPHLATVTSVVTSFGSAALVDGLHDVVDGSHGGHGGDRKSERHRGGAMALFSASAREVGMRNTQKHASTGDFQDSTILEQMIMEKCQTSCTWLVLAPALAESLHKSKCFSLTNTCISIWKRNRSGDWLPTCPKPK